MTRRSRPIAALGITLAIAAGCGRTSDDADVPSGGAGGASAGTTGGAVNMGGVGGGASRGGVVEIGGSLLPSPAVLPDGCVPTPQKSDREAASGQHRCFRAADFTQPHSPRSGTPTLLESTGGAASVGGAAGAAGAAGASPAALDTCPLASELDWSCSPSEGRCCSIPQCEAPDDFAIVAGQCCYFVYRSCGV